MKINNNTVVSLSYILKENDAEGRQIEMTKDTEPLVFIYGAGLMIPKFEEHLFELSAGDDFEFTLASADAYGEYEDGAIIDLDINIFAVDGKVDEKLIEIGNILPMRDNNGHILQGRVMGVTESAVQMDFNHPMAGKTLHFQGKVLNVREATPDELSHGHVHGDGGVHH